MPVVINEFEAVTTPAPEPRREPSPAATPGALDRHEIEAFLRMAAERELRVAAD